MSERVDVAIVGGGPAGLSAAAALTRAGAGSVLVIERERAAGGIPRHADHPGFGVRDLHRALRGPVYARRLTDRALAGGASLRLGTQVTGWTSDGVMELTGAAGRSELSARAILLATGCRERPRAARLIPGSRPLGAVMNTGQLQQMVHLDGVRLDGRRAVVVGAEHVSYSALHTLHTAGASTVAMVTDQPRHQSFAAFALGARVRYGAPLMTGATLASIDGTPSLTGVTVARADGSVAELACDLLVLTGDWIPDHEIAVLGGARLDPGSRGPAIGAGGHTTVPGVFAAGNVLAGAETADWAGLDGTEVARGVLAHLGGTAWPAPPVPIRCEAPLHWLVPGARGRARLRSHMHLRDVRIEVAQGSRVLDRRWLARVMPARSVTVRARWLDAVDPAGPPVDVRAVRARPVGARPTRTSNRKA